MEAFARNNLTSEVPGTNRRDELGDMARTVAVFKKNGLEVERMRADQLVTEKRNTEQRKADMYKLADDFEGAVGEIIETVSSASTELEASASTLTSTAERAQELTTMVRNVQQAALGTQQVSSNITDVQRGASETGSASSQVLSAAQSLSGDSNRLKLEVGKFLHSVRAA